MNNEELYLSKDLAEKVAPIMERLGIEPDGYYVIETGVFYHRIYPLCKREQISTYRKDKLELALSLAGFECKRNGYSYEVKIKDHPIYEVNILHLLARVDRINSSLEATANLLLLLEEEGLLKEK